MSGSDASTPEAASASPRPHLDWATRYRDQDTPWDLGRAHPELLRRLAAGELGRPARALVPGCGRGHDALALAEAGWRVTALDLVELDTPALRALRACGSHYLVADALAFELRSASEPFDLVLDHTFFCALDPARRPDWGRLVERTLSPDGRLVALVFPCGKTPVDAGPPFAMSAHDLAAALGERFTLERDEPAAERAAKRTWEERWAVFRRRPSPRALAVQPSRHS